MFISEETLDDLLRKTITKLLKKGTRVTSTKGTSIELDGVLLELKNPRARLSRTETKGTLFSCLGEFLWYLSGSNSLEIIQYYIPTYDRFSDDGSTLFGAYGPRLLKMHGKYNQIQNVIDLLSNKNSSRQAVIQIFDAQDITLKTKDLPCTCTLQFLIRNDRLNMITYMRSNDVYLGLPHDIFSFSMLQEIIASSLGIDIGNYKHAVGSLHLYEDKLEKAKQYLDEGWQSTQQNMPKMPNGYPWENIDKLLEIESKLRCNQSPDISSYEMPNYWSDLARLIQIYSATKSGKEANDVYNNMSTEIYRPYIEKRINITK